MKYLGEREIEGLGISWKCIITELEHAVECLKQKDYAQPIKPYLRYRNKKNRFIAMPAFVGGSIDAAGIKWIASFPDNLKRNIPRAHSVVILNSSETGQPVCIINTVLLSIIRTAGVSGMFLRRCKKSRNLNQVNLGIIGYGPIGRYHHAMCREILKGSLGRIYLYDKQGIKDDAIVDEEQENVTITDNWQEVYEHADILITCTVADGPYIDLPPKKGMIILNVSLRDIKPEAVSLPDHVLIVDDWDEVCRENTDIERLHQRSGLRKEHTKSIVDVVCGHCLDDIAIDQPISFHPMGMAVFDLAVGSYYYKLAEQVGKGVQLD